MISRFNKFMGTVREGLQYSIFEGIFLIIVLADLLMDRELTQWWLWLGAILAVLWTLTALLEETKTELKRLVLDREVFITDFWMSAFILSLITLTISGESLWIVGCFLLAIGQNLRYSYLSMQWLLEERREQRKQEGHSDDDMSGV